MGLKVVLLGPPGAGKGTQAGILNKRFRWAHISTGDMLREAVKRGSPEGLKAGAYMDRGELVPDELVIAMVRERLKEKDAGEGFLLDGFPRTREQAVALDAALDGIRRKLDVALYFKTSEKVIIKRLTGRRICRSCGKIYHTVNMPPKKSGVCDLCGGPLYQRTDDAEETVRRRLGVYEAQTAPLIEYYGKNGILREISGDTDASAATGLVEKIFAERERSLKK